MLLLSDENVSADITGQKDILCELMLKQTYNRKDIASKPDTRFWIKSFNMRPQPDLHIVHMG